MFGTLCNGFSSSFPFPPSSPIFVVFLEIFCDLVSSSFFFLPFRSFFSSRVWFALFELCYAFSFCFRNLLLSFRLGVWLFVWIFLSFWNLFSAFSLVPCIHHFSFFFFLFGRFFVVFVCSCSFLPFLDCYVSLVALACLTEMVK